MEAKIFLNKVSGDFFSVVEAYYISYLKNIDEDDIAVENLIQIFQCDFETDDSYPIEKVRDEREYELVLNETSDIVHTLADNLIKQNLSEESFYKKLLKTIKDDTFFTSDLARVCALIHLLQSPKMPYYYLPDGIKMEDDEFVEISKSLIPELKKVRFVLNVGFSQKTEMSSKLLQILEKISDEKKRAVLLANIIGVFEYNIISLKDQLKQLTSKTDE